MEETTNKKKAKKQLSKEKEKIYLKRRIIAVGVLIIVVALIVTLILFLTPDQELEFTEAILENNYYIKMIEVDENFNEKGEAITFTRDGDDIVIHTEKQTIILKDDVYAQVFHNEKIIAQYPRDSIMNNINVGVNGLEGDEVAQTKEEELNGEKYICKTYKSGLKIYYDNEDVKYYITDDGIAKILEFEGKVREDMFELPEDYTVANSEEK